MYRFDPMDIIQQGKSEECDGSIGDTWFGPNSTIEDSHLKFDGAKTQFKISKSNIQEWIEPW